MEEPRVGGRQLGRYVLHDEIASGGMASVHFGRVLGPVGFSRTVAIKKLHPHLARDPEFVTMFLDEARLAARVHHPNVVATLDMVAREGELFLVMDYVNGESLSQLLRSAREAGVRPPLHVVASILSGVLHGLHAAHEATSEQGESLAIVHRDISPQNILVGVDGVSRIIDFGVAKAAMRAQSTKDGQVKGKLAYMSPEQLEAKKVDRRTDIYAASVVLWEALASRRLFAGDDAGGVVTAILQSKITPLADCVPDLPNGVAELVSKGLARDASDRFPTALAMALELEKVLPAAPQHTVAEWVKSRAADRLEARSQRLARIEITPADQAGADTSRDALPAVPYASKEAVKQASEAQTAKVAPAEPNAAVAASEAAVASREPISQVTEASLSTDAPQRARSRRRGVILGALGLGLATAIALSWTQLRPRASASAEAAPSTLDSAKPTAEAPATAASPSSTEATAPGVSAVTTTMVPKPSPPKVAAPARPAPTAKHADCDPPYTIDAAGVKRFKPRCF